MSHRLDGRVSMVTGGGHGIGKVYREGVAAEGSAVVVADLEQEQDRQQARGGHQSGCPGSLAPNYDMSWHDWRRTLDL